MDARRFQYRIFGRRRSCTTIDNSPRVAHALALGRRGASNESHHRFTDMRMDKGRRIFLHASADLAHHDNHLGLRVRLKKLQDFRR